MSLTPAMASGSATNGSVCVLLKLPTRPDSEFTSMNSAETAEAVLVRAQCIKIRSGVRKMPPPVPVNPASNPRPAPMPSAAGRDGVCGSSSSEVRMMKRV